MTTVLLHSGAAAPKLETPRPQVKVVRGGNRGLNRARRFAQATLRTLALAIVLGLVISVLYSHAKLPFLKLCATAVAGLLVPYLLSALVRIRAMTGPAGETSVGKFYILICFILAFSADTGAYFVGRAWGKHKLAPVISPKKTVEGALGGLVGSVVVVPPVMLIARLIMLIRGVAVTGADIPNMWVLLLVSLLAGAASQIGDLAASTVKRWCGVKDYSNILPGHGGIMDRIDSVLFSIVVFHIYSGLFMRAAL